MVSTVLVTVAGLGLTFLVGPWLRPVGVVLPLQVLLLSVPVNVLWAPAQAAIERRLVFRRMGLLELVGDLVLYGTAVPLALCGFGPWSLVAGYFAWQAWLLVGSLVLSGTRPRPAWSWATSRDLLHHGLTYSLSTWLVALRGSATALIVGTFAGATGVGFMSFAQRLVTTLNFTSRGVHRVGIAAIARAGRPDRPRLSRAMEEGTLLLMLVAAAPFAAFGLAAPLARAGGVRGLVGTRRSRSSSCWPWWPCSRCPRPCSARCSSPTGAISRWRWRRGSSSWPCRRARCC